MGDSTRTLVLVDPEVRMLIDQTEIVAVASRYCWAVDRLDRPAFDEVFLADATASLGTGLQSGIDEIWGRVHSILAPLTSSQHIVGSHLVVVDGNRAEHRHYFQTTHVWRGKDGGDQFSAGGTVEDRLERTPQGWRIRHRDSRVTWSRGNRDIVRR